MAARDIAYVELYTKDKQAAVDYFSQSLGFVLAAESDGHGKSTALLWQGGIQLLITAGPATRDFVDAHGDGVADIALICDDVAETRDAAVAAGASAGLSGEGNPTVSAFGDTVHTLLPAGVPLAGRPPAGRTWKAAPAVASLPDGGIRLLDHIAICLPGEELPGYADFCAEAFGCTRYSSEYVAVADQAMNSIVARNPGGGITFTLVGPDPAKRPGQLNAFLAANSGPGVQHLAFLVDDIVLAVRTFSSQGARFLEAPPSYYEILADRFTGLQEEIASLRASNVLADRDEWGYLLQLFTRSPHERGTLFYELIQRRGARGFGTANIRALYEAVERDRIAAI